MKFEDAIKTYGGDAVGGLLIVYHEGVHIVLGKHFEGQFVPDIGEAAEKFMAKVKPKKAAIAAPTKGVEPEVVEEPAVEEQAPAEDLSILGLAPS